QFATVRLSLRLTLKMPVLKGGKNSHNGMEPLDREDHGKLIAGLSSGTRLCRSGATQKGLD
ncbi:MAG: hypothetical protein WCD18_01775, partial [Thermosynechococcaceae cyanobacterium]